MTSAARPVARPGSSTQLRWAGVTLACLLAAPTLRAQAPLDPTASPATAERERGEELAPTDELASKNRYLLHLRSGQVLRGVARETADGWEVKRGSAWQRLPSGVVDRALEEKDVLAEARRMRRATDRDDAAQRTALATWMVDQGLLAEAASELDLVLTLEPDLAPALALIERAKFPANLPQRSGEDEGAWRAELLTFGAKATPVGRELVVAELRELEGQDALGAALSDDLSDGSDRRRSFAAHALRRLFPGRQIKPLLSRAVLDSSEDVRREAAVALRGAHDAAVIVPIVRALNSRTPAVRTNAAQALGHVGHPAAVEPLMTSLMNMAQVTSSGRVPHSHIFVGKQFAYIQDFDVEVAQFQAVADPQINVLTEGSVLDAGVHAVREYVTTHEKRVTRGALRRLTGADPGDRIEDWRRWWEEHKDSWRSEDLSRPPVTGPRTGEAGVELRSLPRNEASDPSAPEIRSGFQNDFRGPLIRPRPVTRFTGVGQPAESGDEQP